MGVLPGIQLYIPARVQFLPVKRAALEGEHTAAPQ